jgi:hypothetical protein
MLSRLSKRAMNAFLLIYITVTTLLVALLRNRREKTQPLNVRRGDLTWFTFAPS